MPLVREGRVWKFGDDVNTDLVFPNRAFRMPLAEQHRLVFSANRPGWVDEVGPGDLIVAGENYGMGSGRPVGRLLAECGIAGVVAESVNGLCLRNCVTYGFPALAVPGIVDAFDEGERARIDFASGLVENLDRGTRLEAPGLPPLLRDLVVAGGTIPMLIREGFIESEPRLTASS
jgi:3-isopropylmalate/(R)-2-methylmalate dehydratase small subunit